MPASLAVGISGEPSAAFLGPRTCPYSGFSNDPEYDNLLRCLRSPVWFTFDPPGSPVGGTIVARSDRSLSAAVAGASISLVKLPVEADLVPASHGRLVPVGHVGRQVTIRVPDVPAGLYEAVVSCPLFGSAPSGQGSIRPARCSRRRGRRPTGIKIVSYALAAALAAAVILTLRTWRRRRQLRAGSGRR